LKKVRVKALAKRKLMTPKKLGEPSETITVTVASEIEDLIPGYLENRKKDIESITEALTHGDYTTIQTLGHSMKGSGGGYGFKEITIIGNAIEQASKIEDAAQIQKQIDRLAEYLEKVEIVFEDN